MDKKQQLINRKLAGLSPLVPSFQSQIGDGFNLQNLATLLVQLETQNEMTPQLTEATEYAQFIPVRQNFPAVLGTSHELKRKKGIGEGQPYSGTGNDIPLAEAIYDTITLPVKAGVIGYEYSIMELATASQMGLTLESDKIDAARLAFEKHMSNVAWFGESSTGLKGFFNQSGVAITTAAKAWETATPEEILTDFNDIVSDAIDAGEFNASIRPDTILLPTSLMKVLISRRVNDNIETLFKYISDNNMLTLQGQPLTIRASSRAESAGTAETRRIVVYRRDPSCIEMRIPQDLTFLSPQPKGLDVFTPGHYLYQGVYLKRVDSLRYLDVPKAA